MKLRYGLMLTAAGLLGGFTLPAGALGLGELEVLSHLNEPLYARIEVRDILDSDWSLLQARVVLDEHAVLAPQVLEQLSVHLTRNSGRHYLEIRSAERITEPAFDLPLEVSVPGARVLRACAVLLDPGAFAPADTGGSEPAALESAAGDASSPATPSDAARPPPGDGTASQAGAHATRTRGAHGMGTPLTAAASRYTVRSGDTLARIVGRLEVHGERHRDQVMHWIYAHNRPAFYGGMHHLHSGAHLVLPGELGASLARSDQSPAAKPASPAAAAGSERVPEAPAGRSGALLEQRLAELQGSIARMQETISIQNAQILGLTRQLQRQQATNANAAVEAASVAPGRSRRGTSGGRVLAWILLLLAAAALAIRTLLRRSKQAVAPAREAERLRAPGDADAGAPALVPDTLASSSTALPTGAGVPQPAGAEAASANATQAATGAATPPPERRRAPERTAAPALEDDVWTSLYGAETWRDRDDEARPAASSPDESLPMVGFEELTTLLTQAIESTAPMPALEPQSGAGASSSPPPEAAPPAAAAPPVEVARPRAPADRGASRKGGATPITSAATARLRRATAHFEVTEERSLETEELKTLLGAAIKRDPRRVEMGLQLLEIYQRESMRSEFDALAAQLLDPARKLCAEQRAQIETLRRGFTAESSGELPTESSPTQPMAKIRS